MTPDALRRHVAAALHIGLDDATPNQPEDGAADHERWVARVQEWADWIHEAYAPHLQPETPAADPVTISVSRDLLSSLVDEDACWFDHHGGCQGHGYLSLEPGEKCPQAEVKTLLGEPAEVRND
jgi:hypothetical protein